MRFPHLICWVLVALSMAASSFADEIDLPAETVSYHPSDSLGYPLVLKNCVACHSAHYVLTQPPNLPRDYWNAMVYKMKNVFGAPIAEEEIPYMVDYLVKQYGDETSVPMPAKK